MSEDECLELLATDGMLVKRPMLVDEYRALVGFNNVEWMSLFGDSNIVLGYAAHITRVHGCRNIAVNREMFDDHFFDLSSGLLGEVAEKLADSNYRLAIVGDFSGCASNTLKDFIHESNMGRHLYFVADEEEALKKLGGS